VKVVKGVILKYEFLRIVQFMKLIWLRKSNPLKSSLR
jgi:hypothetical protein